MTKLFSLSLSPGTRHRWGLAALLVTFVGLSGCTTVEATAPTPQALGKITIEHTTNQFLFAQLRAEEYCTDFDADVAHLRTGPIATNVLLLQTNVSVFECIPRPKKPAAQ